MKLKSANLTKLTTILFLLFLVSIFNFFCNYITILLEGIFSTQSLVAVIPKSGCIGVRPISLSCFLKIMEKMVYIYSYSMARLDTDQLDTTNHIDRLEAFHCLSAVSGSCSIDNLKYLEKINVLN